MGTIAQIGSQDLEEATAATLVKVGRFACDIETSGLDPRADQIGTVQIHADRVGTLILKMGAKQPHRFCKIMEDPNVLKIFHHATFDIRFMVEHWKIEPAAIACTKIASKLANPQASSDQHTLKALLLEKLGIAITKQHRLSDWLTENLTEDQVRYAAADVEYLLDLYDRLRRDLEFRGVIGLYERCVSFIPTRVRLDLGGWDDVFSY